MTTMIDHIESTRTSAVATQLLLEVMEDALAACADHDLALYGSTTTAGSALLSLADLARTTVSALDESPGGRLTDGPGVVVVRYVAATTRMLGRAVSMTSGAVAGADVAVLVPAAKGFHAALLEALTPAA